MQRNISNFRQNLNRATGIHSATTNYNRPRFVVLTIVQQTGKFTGNDATSSSIATSKFLITQNGVVIDARPHVRRSHICNFSTMQRGASWPSNLNLRLARYHLRVRSSEDLSKYPIAGSSSMTLDNDRLNTLYHLICFAIVIF